MEVWVEVKGWRWGVEVTAEGEDGDGSGGRGVDLTRAWKSEHKTALCSRVSSNARRLTRVVSLVSSFCFLVRCVFFLFSRAVCPAAAAA